MSDELLVVMPSTIPFLGMAIALVLPTRLKRWWSLGILSLSLLISVWLLAEVWQGGEPIVFQAGGWLAPFGITFVADMLAAVLVLVSQFVMLMGLIYALQCRDSVVSYPTFFTLYLGLACGLTGAYLTGDMFNLFVFAELVVISGSILIASSDHIFGPEAAYKYFYMSLLAATFLLLANGTLYVAYGTLNMAQLAEQVASSAAHPLLPMSIGLLFATFMIKGAVLPMHMWQPDIYHAAPTPVGAVLSSVVVKLGFYGFLRMTTLLFVEQAEIIRWLLIIFGAAGILYGGFSAIGTHNLKRMLAYSTLAQIGFILIGVGWGSALSIAAAIVFAVNHSLIKAAMIMLAGAIASRVSVKSASFAVITGAGQQLPVMGIMFFLGALALSGIPPTNGFISKLLLFRSGVESSQYLVLLVMAVGSMATVIYIMRAFQRIWFSKPDNTVAVKVSGDRLLAPIVLLFVVLILGLWAEPLVRFSQDTAAMLSDPYVYIRAVFGG